MKTRFLLRITIMLFLLFYPLAASAQDSDENEIAPAEEPPLQVFTQTSLQYITAGTPWTLTLFVNHAVPDEVTVITPSFAPSLTLDRIVKSPRAMGTGIHTVIEYRFIPSSSGIFFIEPFTVITPHGITETERHIIDVRSLRAEQVQIIPRISWEGSPRQMAAGERIIIALRITGLDSGRWPPSEFFMPEVPRGVILVSSPLTEHERESGIAVKLILIPMETGDFILPARTLQHENIVFQIPALNIRVTGADDALKRNSGQVDERINTHDFGTTSVNAEQFPDFIIEASKKNISEANKKQCEKIYNTAKNLWNNGLYAQALAELRRNERNHPAGALLRPIRKEAEKNLGFLNTMNESREHLLVLKIISFSFMTFVIISLFICFFIKGSVFLKRTALVCAVIFTAAGLYCFYRLMDSNPFLSGNRFGVTYETPVRRTADYDGEELFRFREGQPAVIMLNSGDWLFIRANDAEGKSGWIPAGEVIFY